MTDSFWRILSDVRAEERTRFGFFVGLAALVSAAQTVGLAGSEAILLSRLGADVLPQLFVLASAVTVVATLSYAAVVGRARNDRLFVGVLALSALAVGAGHAALELPLDWVPAALLCAYFASQAILLNHFLTFAGDYFDTLASKRLVPLFTLGGSAGGVVGGAIAATVGRPAPELLVAGWAALLVAAAGWLLAFSRPLRRWRSLGFEEADETSVQGIVASLRYARRSRLSRWLVVSVVTMVISLFVSQYLYSRVLAETFPSTGELAAFLGFYLAVTNVLEIAVELWGTPLLIRRFGVASANLVHAGLTVASFAAMAVDLRLATAVGARLNREMLDAALAQPVRNLVYNALPLRLRGRMRAFLEGILHFSAMSLAGALLLLAGRPDPVWLCLLGAGTALLYLGANLRVRSAYLDALVEQLREGRLDLASVEAGLGAAEVGRLGRLWAELLRQVPTPTSAISELAPLLAARQTLVPLLEGLGHEDADVRLACVTALAGTDTPTAEHALLAALRDDDAAVRLTALRALGDEVGSGRLEQCLSDPDPRVCAAAALRLGARGAGVLREMAASGDAAQALAALTQLPHQLRADAEARLADRDPRVRAAALGRFAAWARSGDLSLERIEAFLSDESTVVRGEAVRAADAIHGSGACRPLSRALDDPARSVRRSASEALARHGDLGVEAAEPLLRQGPWTADAALSVLGRVNSSRARTSLRYELRARVTGAWENLLSLHALVGEADVHARLLRTAHADGLSRNVRMAFRALRHLEGAQIVASVDRVLRMGTARARGDALELLSNLGDRAASGRLALLLEPAPLEERMRSSGETVTALEPRAVRERARHSSDRWVRMAVSESTHRGDGEGTMERLLALKQVPLLAQLSLDQLESVNRAMTVQHFARGDVVVREGERGNRLYVVLEGKIEIWSSWGTDSAVQLNILQPVSTFGEMAVLHEQTRTATAVVSEEALLTSLDGDRLKELILRMPEISFVILGELVQRARRAEERLRGQNGREPPSG